MDRIITKPNTSRLRRPTIVVAIILALAGAGVILGNVDFRTHRVDRTQLTIDTVRRGTMEIKVAANGQLVSTRVEHLAARVGGRVAKADVKPGTVVRAGDVIVELENPQLMASADEARSAWEGARSELVAAEAELHSNMLNQEVVLTQVRFSAEKAKARAEADEALAKAGLISNIERDRSRLDFEQLRKTAEIETKRLQKLRDNISVQLAVRRSRVAQLARARERARTDARNLKIVAGIGGVVQSIDVEVGQQVQPGSALGRIAQQDHLYAELRVPAREATEVRAGQKVVIDTRTGIARGIVKRVDPGVTDGTVIVDVDIEGPLPTGARPQMQIEGVIYITQVPDTLHVAKPAYVKRDTAISVYKLDADGRYATRTTIEAGKVSLDRMQVVHGLREGDRIITSEVGAWQDHDRILLK